MHSTAPPAPPALTIDEIDDLLYFTRVNESEDLKKTIAELAQRYQCGAKEVLEAAVDPENGNSALHYCAANGLAGEQDTHVNTVLLVLMHCQIYSQPSSLTCKSRKHSQSRARLHRNRPR